MKKRNTIRMMRMISVVIASLMFTACSGDGGVNGDNGGNGTDDGNTNNGGTGFVLRSTSITNGGVIAEKYSCNGSDTSPQLSWNHAPSGTKSYTVIMDDPDAQAVIGSTYVHWNVYFKDATMTQLSEGASGSSMPAGTIDSNYEGPCPPVGETHTYHLCVYALSKTDAIPDKAKNWNQTVTRNEYETQFQTSILGQACLEAHYTGK